MAYVHRVVKAGLCVEHKKIVNEIMRHYAANGIIAKRYEVQYPIRWATQEEDTHPYYFAAVGLKVYAPAIFKEVPET